MNSHAEATFDIESWDEEPCDESEGVKLTRTRVTKTFHGDLEGESRAELLMAYLEGSAAYLGFERFTGRVHGRFGSFVLKHDATASGGAQSASWTVVPDSGTGELRGLFGEAQMAKEPGGGHVFTLDYAFEREEHRS
jgi:hypothetical protein